MWFEGGIFKMVEGKVSARAVALQDLMSDLKVLDKREISLGILQLSITEQTKRTVEEEIEQKHKMQIEENNTGNINIKAHSESNVKEEDEEKTIDDEAEEPII